MTSIPFDLTFYYSIVS
uniref:Uncharacterized protein n=1 Tax=Rhizophora mucronata TaxID=61149 RepID=A0A2P2MEY5_RHIMU